MIIVAKLKTIDEGYVEEDVDENMEEDNEEDIEDNMEDITDNMEDIEDKMEDVEPRQHRPFSYSSPLPWLAARLEMLTPASNLSEIILRLNLSVTDAILKNIDWADLTRILSSKSLPSLNLATLKVSGQYTPLTPAQWDVLRSNRHLSPLVDDGRLVVVNSIPP